MGVHEAIRIILSDTAKFSTSLNYAVNYCRAGLQMPEGGNDLRVQCLYILSNITHWRHPQAKDVRTALKKGSKK